MGTLKLQALFSIILVVSILVNDADAQAQPGLQLEIRGLTTVPEDLARELFEDQWEVIEERGLSPSRAADAAFLIELGLRNRGLMDASVNWAIGENNRLLILTVNEGPPVTLGDVEIIGSQRVEQQIILDLLTEDLREEGPTSGETSLPYVEDEISKGRDRIEAYYMHEGFRDVVVILEEPRLNQATRTMDLEINIVEGKRHKITAVDLTGVDSEAHAELMPQLEPFVGLNVNDENLREMEDLVLGHYSNNGFYDAIISTEQIVEPSDPLVRNLRVRIELTVDPGALYRVTDLHFSGNDFAHDEFMRARFASLMYEPYSPAEVSEVFRDLAETGIFSDVIIDTHPLSAGSMALDVKVEEAKLREIGFYGGFGSFDGYIIGSSYVDRGLFGPGRVLRSQIEMNARGLEGNLDYEDRWFLLEELSLASKLYSRSRRLQGYDKLELGLRAGLTYKFTDATSLSMFGEAVHTEITDQSFRSTDIGKTSYWIHALGLSLTINKTDDVLTPRKGWLWEGALSYAGPAIGSEIHFLRGTSRFGFYWPGPKDSDFRAGFRVAAMMPMGETDVLPIDTRFFIGGSRSVRSFPERELGMLDASGDPVGGEFFTIFNLEYSIPVIGGLEAAAFFDAGNLQRDLSDAGFGDMHYAAGLGIRYNLPVGPLRLDYGYNLNQQEGEPDGTFHFAFGFAF